MGLARSRRNLRDFLGRSLTRQLERMVQIHQANPLDQSKSFMLKQKPSEV
jgi:hypothetical protein